MSKLSRPTFQEIVDILIPHCTDLPSRKSLATTALFGCSVLNHLDYSDTTYNYAVHLVTTLLDYGKCIQGKEALVLLLEQVRMNVGLHQQMRINQVISEISGQPASSQPVQKNLYVLRVYIAASTQLISQQEVIVRAIERLNRQGYIRSRCVLKPVLHDDEIWTASANPSPGKLNRYKEQLKDSHLFVSIKQAATESKATNQNNSSSVEELIRAALSLSEGSNNLKLLLYESTTSAPEAHTKSQITDNNVEQVQNPSYSHVIQRTFAASTELEQRVFQDIERYVIEHMQENTKQEVQLATHPKLIEQTRRFDAAMPLMIQMNQPTELWAQVCLPDSKGFHDKLPHSTDSGDVITTQSIADDTLTIAFAVDSSSGTIRTAAATIEVVAPDFDVADAMQHIQLSRDRDSGLIVFSLIPTVARKRSIVHVKLRFVTPDGLEVTAGSLTLYTEVAESKPQNIGQVLWSLVGLSLNTGQPARRSRSGRLQSSPTASDETPSIPYLPVRYHQQMGWVVLAGMIHGLTEMAHLALYPYEIHDLTQTHAMVTTAKIKNLGANESSLTLDNPNALHENTIYKAVITEYGQSLLLVNGLSQTLPETSALYQSHFLDVEDGLPYDVQVGTDDDGLWISPSVEFSSAQPVTGLAPQSVGQTLLRIAHTKHIRDLHNPAPHQLSWDSLQITLYRLENEDTPLWTNTTASDVNSVQIPYAELDGQWKFPRFAIHCTNQTPITLYCCLMYVQLDNVQPLMRDGIKEVAPNDSFTIRLGGKVEDSLWMQGIFSIQEHMKWLISTQPFDVNAFTQIRGSRSSQSDFMRQLLSSTRRSRGVTLDWFAGDLQIIIYRSQDARPEISE